MTSTWMTLEEASYPALHRLQSASRWTWPSEPKLATKRSGAFTSTGEPPAGSMRTRRQSPSRSRPVAGPSPHARVPSATARQTTLNTNPFIPSAPPPTGYGGGKGKDATDRAKTAKRIPKARVAAPSACGAQRGRVGLGAAAHQHVERALRRLHDALGARGPEGGLVHAALVGHQHPQPGEGHGLDAPQVGRAAQRPDPGLRLASRLVRIGPGACSRAGSRGPRLRRRRPGGSPVVGLRAGRLEVGLYVGLEVLG